MDIGTIFGVLLGIGLVLYAILQLLMESEPDISVALIQMLDFFASTPSILIVLGGSLAATLMSFPVKETLRFPRVIAAVMRKERDDPSAYIDEIITMAKAHRKSSFELENIAEDGISHPFLKDGAEMIVQGYSESKISGIMTTRIESDALRHKADAKLLGSVGKYAPAFGMIGTLVGLVVMMQSLGTKDGDPMENLATGMGAALITTLYGTILANMFFLPLGEKIDKSVDITKNLKYMMLEGLVLVLHKQHPLFVKEKMNAYLPPRMWIDDFDNLKDEPTENKKE